MKKNSLVVWLLLFVAFNLNVNAQTFENYGAANSTVSKIVSQRAPSSVNWFEGGNKYSYISYNSELKRSEIRSFDPKKNKDELIFNGEGVFFPDSDSKTEFKYVSFQWSADSKFLLFKSNFRPIYRNSGIADFYLYSIADKSLVLAAKDARTAELSPDGKLMGFERGGNLYIREMATGVESQLTNDATDHIFNGHFGWAYEEEFGLAQAWEWSPDSRYIAFWQEDENEVPEFQMTDYEGLHPNYTKIRYPAVGDPNPKVRIGVITIADKSAKWLDVKETEEHYIPRINWTGKDHFLSVMVLNRKQNHLKIHFFDTRSGEGKIVLDEKSTSWIDVYDFFAGIHHFLFFPKGGNDFFWISDKDGYSHLYRYDYNGKELNQVTKGNWDVTFVHGFDTKNKQVYYTSTEVSPLERQLYRIKYDGKKAERLTKTTGRHSINLSPNAAFYIDSYSNINQPLTVELWGTNKKKISTLADNSASFETVKSKIQLRELFSFTTSDGQKLDGYLIKPHGFDSTKNYPLMLDIYGGPGAQSVYNEFGVSGWQQYILDQGFVIASVNNRGSGGYGAAFKKLVYRQLGKWEAIDFAETAKFLGAKSWIDENNMAIRGHSYGGYMSSYTMANKPGVFKAAIVAAPLTDWRLYDSIYAERYMDLLNDNEEGYINSAVMTNAKNVTGRILLVHSTMDENVHVQNSFQLITALTSAGIDADVRIYPPGAHGVAYNAVSRNLLYGTVYSDFLKANLKN